jgi:hypothetical protein
VFATFSFYYEKSRRKELLKPELLAVIATPDNTLSR